MTINDAKQMTAKRMTINDSKAKENSCNQHQSTVYLEYPNSQTTFY